MNPVERTRYIVENVKFMVIATAGQDGKPHNSPVAFVADESYNLYWVSSRDAVHSINISARPEVSIAIFGTFLDESVDGAYFEAIAREMDDPELIRKIIGLFAQKRPQVARFETKTVDQVLGDANWRMYVAEPIEVSKRADAEVGGQAVTIREPIDLEDLRASA